MLRAWGDGAQGQEAALVTLGDASRSAALALDATVHTLVLSLTASQAAATAAAASGAALQRLLDDGLDAGVTGVPTVAVAVPPPPPQTLECAALPQMEEKYFIDLSPFAARGSDSDGDGDGARRRLVRVRLGAHLQPPGCSDENVANRFGGP